MGKVLFPFGISVLLAVLFQLVGTNKNNYQNDLFVENSAFSEDEIESLKYYNNFNSPIKDLDTDSLKVLVNDKRVISLKDSAGFRGQFLSSGQDQVNYKFLKTDINRVESRLFKNIESKSGYIALKSLLPGTYPYFMKEMEQLAGIKGLDTLYLDLRNNSAGVEIEAVKIANQLIFDSEVELISEVFMNGTVNTIKSRGKVFYPLKHIYVIADSTTKQTAETLIRMLMKRPGVNIYGSKTYGDQTIRRDFPLSSGKIASIVVGYLCDGCGKVDPYYDLNKLNPITPDKNMSTANLDALLKSKY